MERETFVASYLLLIIKDRTVNELGCERLSVMEKGQHVLIKLVPKSRRLHFSLVVSITLDKSILWVVLSF